MVCRNYTSQK